MIAQKLQSVTVRIGGREYSIRSDADPAYTRKCAQYVNEKMYEIRETMGSLETEKIAILAALSLADNLFQFEEDGQSTTKEMTAVMEAMTEEIAMIISEE